MNASPRNGETGIRIARGIVAGAIAGVVASFVMDRFQAAAAPWLPLGGGDGEPATEQAADAVMRTVTGDDVAQAAKPLAGQMVHYAVGLGLGIAYGVVAEFRPAVTKGCGTAFGIGVATVLDEGLVPAVGLGAPPRKAGLPTNLYSYVSHLVFGTTSEIVRRQVAGTLVR